MKKIYEILKSAAALCKNPTKDEPIEYIDILGEII